MNGGFFVTSPFYSDFPFTEEEFSILQFSIFIQ